MWFLLVFFFLLLVLSFSRIQGFDDSPDFEDSYDAMDGYKTPDHYSDPYSGNQVISATVLNSVDEIESFIKIDDFEPAVIGYFDPANAEEEIKVFKDLASTDGRNYRFAYTTDSEVLEIKKYDRFAVLVYPPAKFVNEKLERSKYRFPGKTITNSVSFREFVIQKTIPLVGEYTTSSESRYSNLNRPLVTIFTAVDHKRNYKGFQYVANRLRKIAKQYHGKIAFAIANIHDYLNELESDYGFESPSVKKIFAGLKDGLVYYSLQEEFSFEQLTKFLKDFEDGRLVGKEKADERGESEEIDYSNSDVTQVNESSFHEIIEESSSDVLLEFYAPWCGHCKSLSPQYKKVATHFKNDPGVIVAAMDATSGNVPSKYSIQGYPTIFFIPATTKEPIPYEEEREASAIIGYIESHKITKQEL